MADEKFQTASEQFHAHLEACKQCEDHPFQLCQVGERLLREAVAAGLPIVQRVEIMRGN